MIRKMLYRVELENGGCSVSLQKPPKGTPYQVRWRLIAEDGKAITNGKDTVRVIDVMHRKACNNWRDCDIPEED